MIAFHFSTNHMVGIDTPLITIYIHLSDFPHVRILAARGSEAGYSVLFESWEIPVSQCCHVHWDDYVIVKQKSPVTC